MASEIQRETQTVEAEAGAMSELYTVTNGREFAGPFHLGYITHEYFDGKYLFADRLEAEACLAVMAKYCKGLRVAACTADGVVPETVNECRPMKRKEREAA